MPLKMPRGVIFEMRQEAKAFNTRLTDEFLDTLTPRQLLGFTHWIWRPDYIKQLEKEGLIEKIPREP